MPPRRRPRAHNGGVQPPPSSVPRVCKFYNQGGCRFGDECKFLHRGAQGNGHTVRSVAPATVHNAKQASYGAAEMQVQAATDREVEANEPPVPQDGREPTIQHGEPLDTTRRPDRALRGELAESTLSPVGTGVDTLRPSNEEVAVPLATAQSQRRKGWRGKKKPCFAFQRTGRCRKGDSCEYSHNPSVVEPGKRQATDQQERIRAQQVAAAARELARREEEERLQIEEERRQEEERLAREHLERLDAEREEREKAEAERIAREHEAALARRAEERDRRQREREERLVREREKALREQEAKRRREAKVTLQFVVQGSNFVTFGPGLDVQRIVPGFDLCKVVIRNLPTDASDKEIANIFKEQGLDETMFKLLECREERGSKVAKFLTRREEAEAMAVGLDELEFRDNLLTFEVEDNTAWGSMKSSSEADTNTLTFFWSAPSVVMIATYATVEEARRKAQELNRRQFGGRTITANMNQRPNGPAAKFWVEASVKIVGLPPATEPFDIHTMAGTIQVRPIKSNNYDRTTFLEQLKVYLRLDGYVADSLTVVELQAATGRMKGTARFPSKESLKRAADRLSRGMPNWPKIRVSEQHQYCISISNAQYRAQKAQWDSMTETARGKKAFVRVNERRNGQVFVNVEGSEEKEVGELKVRVESLVAGERLGAEHWHSTYAHAAKALFDQVKGETSVLVTVDRRLQCLRLFGLGANVAEAKDMIRRDIDRLELMEYTVPIERPSVRFFVATGLPILQEALGEGNVTLDVGSRQCSLKLRGGDDAIKHAQKLVEEAVTAARGGLPVPAQASGSDEGSPCPICYDTPTHPEVLSCGHSCCEPCLRHYISSAATSDTFPLVCMGNEATCNTPISVPIIHRYLTQQRFATLVDAVFASYVQMNSKRFKYCTTPDCTQIYQCDTGKQFHQCPACFSRICSSCNEEAHEGMTCEQRKVQSDPAEQDRLNNEWAQTNNIKKCPTCSVMTEKTEGCNHMTCRCGAHWCWICGRPFEYPAIYEHMNAAHGGIYGEPARQEGGGADQQRRQREEEAARQERVVEAQRRARALMEVQRQAAVAEQARLRAARRSEEERRRRDELRQNLESTWGERAIFKRCPACDVLTDKDGGDNHMLCRCGAHWCWVCRGVFEITTIYAHLRTAHGRLDLTGGGTVATLRGRVTGEERAQGTWQRLGELEDQRRVREAQERRRNLEERERLAEAHRKRQRELAEQATRRQAQKDDRWCAIM